MQNKRTYLDPIHQDIVLDRRDPAQRLVMDLIDTKEFQRLRRIHQLGISSFTFQGAEGSRFTHSVGVMHVASRLIDMVGEKTTSIKEWRPLILSSALLHDIGHGPLSHVTEKIVDYNHEDWSCRIITGPSEVRTVLDEFDRNLADQIVAVLKKTHRPKYISHIVSSQLDCDRFDYLLRDSYMTGTAYGLFALHRILSSMEIDEAHDRIIVVGDKGQTAVEDYLFARYSMYAQVYYHRKNLAARSLLAKLIKRARDLMAAGKMPSFIDAETEHWLEGKPISVDQFLKLDDVQLIYHIKRWSEDQDSILSDLASRFLNRRLPKAVRIHLIQQDQNGEAPVTDIEALENKARLIAKEAGYDPDYYVGIESTGIRPYDYYRPNATIPQTNIIVKTDTGALKELSQLSLTVEALVKGDYESTWLIVPSELVSKISNSAALTPTT